MFSGVLCHRMLWCMLHFSDWGFQSDNREYPVGICVLLKIFQKVSKFSVHPFSQTFFIISFHQLSALSIFIVLFLLTFFDTRWSVIVSFFQIIFDNHIFLNYLGSSWFIYFLFRFLVALCRIYLWCFSVLWLGVYFCLMVFNLPI